MFAVKPYYLSSSGTLDYNFGYIYSTIDSVLKPSTFNLEVPLASSIEATMEWCNRVAAKHDWASENNPICDVSGFYWEHYDGNRQLKRIIPSASPPYQITGDSILGSGFYTRYRDIVKFMGDNTLQNWQSPSGATWTNMEISRANNWENLDDLNTRAKITKGHYHQYIYRGGSQNLRVFGGFFNKSISSEVHVPINASVPFAATRKIGWDDPLNTIMTTMSGFLDSYWFGDGYQYGAKSEWRDWGSTLGYLNYIDSCNPMGNIVYPEYDGENGLIPLPYIAAGVTSPRSIGFSQYKYVIRDLVPASSSAQYASVHSVILENSFAAAFYPVDTRQSVVNRTLKHLLGLDKLGISVEMSGYYTPEVTFTGSDITGTFDYYHDIDRDSNWYGDYKLIYGSIYYPGGSLVGQNGVNYNGSHATEANTMGDRVASKIRNGDYYTLASINIPKPTQPSGTYNYPGTASRPSFTPCVSGGLRVNPSSTYMDVYTPNDNLVFFALFGDPFEGEGIIDASFRINSPSVSWYPGPSLIWGESVTSTIDSNILSTRIVQIYPSSETASLGGWASLEHHSEWW